MTKEKTSKVRFIIKLNEENFPVDIEWIASDSQNKESKKCKSMMVNMWDKEEKKTMMNFLSKLINNMT